MHTHTHTPPPPPFALVCGWVGALVRFSRPHTVLDTNGPHKTVDRSKGHLKAGPPQKNNTNGSEDVVGKDAAVKHVAVSVVPLVLGHVCDKVVLRLLPASGERDLFDLIIGDDFVGRQVRGGNPYTYVVQEA